MKMSKELAIWSDLNFEEQDDYDMWWNEFCNLVGNLVKLSFKNGFIKIKAENLGWNKRSGYKYFSFDPTQISYSVGKSLISEITRSDSTIRVYRHQRGLHINCTHHDNPVNGDRFYLTPCAESTHNRNT